MPRAALPAHITPAQGTTRHAGTPFAVRANERRSVPTRLYSLIRCSLHPTCPSNRVVPCPLGGAARALQVRVLRDYPDVVFSNGKVRLQRGLSYWLPSDEAHPLIMDGVLELVGSAGNS